MELNTTAAIYILVLSQFLWKLISAAICGESAENVEKTSHNANAICGRTAELNNGNGAGLVHFTVKSDGFVSEQRDEVALEETHLMFAAGQICVEGAHRSF